MVTAFGADARLSVGQRAVAPGENEITAARALLATLTLDGALVTGDAIHAQAETAQLVLDRSGDDLFALKANRPAMLKAVAAFFADPPAPLEIVQTTDADHGRIETRCHRVTHSVDWLSGDRAEPGAPAMPGLAALACVEATRDDGPLLPVFRAPGRVAAVVEIGGRRNLRVIINPPNRRRQPPGRSRHDHDYRHRDAGATAGRGRQRSDRGPAARNGARDHRSAVR